MGAFTRVGRDKPKSKLNRATLGCGVDSSTHCRHREQSQRESKAEPPGFGTEPLVFR